MKPIHGICHICGQYKQLTKEHVPPKASPNKQTYIEVPFEKALAAGPNDTPEGNERQGGIWFDRLCSDCNNKYCNRYNPELIKWYREVVPCLSDRLEGSGTLTARNVYPLRLIKGFVAMFLTINPLDFRTSEVGKLLADLVMNKMKTGLPAGVSVYLYLNHTGQLRYLPFQIKFNRSIGVAWKVSEVTYPPFGVVMALNSSIPDHRLCAINQFAQYDYDDIGEVDLELAILPTYQALHACDYRFLEEITKG